jgi:hypothetical protein
MSKCVGHIRREFCDKATGERDGSETEFVYEDHPLAEQIRNACSVREVQGLFGDESNDVFRITITSVRTRKGQLPYDHQ